MSLPTPVLHRSGQGPAVLLLHPLGVDSSFWDDVVPSLDGFEVLSYDLPGHGTTPTPDADYTVEELTDQAAALIEAAGVDRVHVVGVSLGGLVAQDLAARHPTLVGKLVVVDAVAVYPPPLREQWRDRAARTPTDGLAPLLEPTLALWFTADRLQQGGAAVERVRSTFLAGDPRGYARACAALEAVDLTDRTEDIRVPTLVVVGEDDAPPFTAAARTLVELVPGARLVTLALARHAGVLEQPEQFTRALLAFLRDEAPR
jgi:3-oxoadipate enol-lactonase